MVRYSLNQREKTLSENVTERRWPLLGFLFVSHFFIQFCFVSSVPPEIGAFSFSKEVMDEGDFAQLSCIVNSGDEPLTLTWAFHGDQVGPETGITTTNLGPRMSILIINSVGHRHQGKYTCTAKNDAGTAVRNTELNVNGNSCS
jgi:hypothetical protein